MSPPRQPHAEFAPDIERQIDALLAALATLPPDARAETLRRACERWLSPERERGRGRNRHDDDEMLTSRLSALDDPSDPLAALAICGSLDDLRIALAHEPLGVLQAMLRHPRLPPGPAPRGQTRAALSRAIVRRLGANGR